MRQLTEGKDGKVTTEMVMMRTPQRRTHENCHWLVTGMPLPLVDHPRTPMQKANPLESTWRARESGGRRRRGESENCAHSVLLIDKYKFHVLFVYPSIMLADHCDECAIANVQ